MTAPIHCGSPMSRTVPGWICWDCLTHLHDQTPEQREADRIYHLRRRWRENREAVDRGEPPPNTMKPDEVRDAKRIESERKTKEE